MSVAIVFEAHSTSLDNETGTASGHFDCPLSHLGRDQAAELGERYRRHRLDAVFCSDLRRSWETGEIAFREAGVPVERDPRLRECDYGHHVRRPSAVIAGEAAQRVSDPFPGGESYEQVNARMRRFLIDVAMRNSGGKVLVIGHRATQYALEYWLEGTPLTVVISTPWSWQPGWRYEMSAAAMRRLVEADDRT